MVLFVVLKCPGQHEDTSNFRMIPKACPIEKFIELSIPILFFKIILLKHALKTVDKNSQK
jgi:hypothetical protein